MQGLTDDERRRLRAAEQDSAKVLPSDAWFEALPLRGQPTQARARATVVRILQAARQIVEQRGLDALTTAAVSQVIDAPIGTVYRYFRDRDELIQALIAQDRFEIDREVMTRCATVDLREWRTTLRQIVWTLADVARARPGYLMLRTLGTASARHRIGASAQRWLDTIANLPGAERVGVPRERLLLMITVGIHAIQGNLQMLYDAPADQIDAMVDEVTRIVVLYIEDIGRQANLPV